MTMVTFEARTREVDVAANREAGVARWLYKQE